jgi:uncharacterized protein (UPF0210 family)
VIRSDQILSTVAMIQEEKLDVRAVTLGVSLLDCRGATPGATADAVHAKLCSVAGDLVAVCDAASERFGVPITNKRLAVTPVAHIAAGFGPADFVSLARALDDAAVSLGVDLLGGFSANVENGTTSAAEAWIESLPEALAETRHVCASVQVGTTRHGLNMDAVGRVAVAIKRMAERTSGEGGFAAAKFVVFMNQPDDNPFMAGAIHGLGQPDAVINIGVSGPGVIARAVERRLAQPGDAPQLQDLAEEIKRTSFRVTRTGELIGRYVADRLGLPFGSVDLSLAPTPDVGDSVGEIIRLLGVDAVGAPGTTAIVAMLNDAVKKGGAFASSSVGGLSGAFLPVCEDRELARAAADGSLTLEKLEAMTSVCSVGLDMIAIPGDTDEATLTGLIADEMAIGLVNNKTTAVRAIPVPGKAAGEFVAFGGLFGESVILPVRNTGKSSRFAAFGGKIPAPLHSLRN